MARSRERGTGSVYLPEDPKHPRLGLLSTDKGSGS